MEERKTIGPPIGIILMVVFSILMAAIISGFVFGAAITVRERVLPFNVTIKEQDNQLVINATHNYSSLPFEHVTLYICEFGSGRWN